jgi:hypothetical protein
MNGRDISEDLNLDVRIANGTDLRETGREGVDWIHVA